MSSFGERMRRARHLAGINSYRLAEELGVTKAALYAYETGRVEPPDALKAQIVKKLQIRSTPTGRRLKPWSDRPPEELTALISEDPGAFASACIAIGKAQKRSPS